MNKKTKSGLFFAAVALLLGHSFWDAGRFLAAPTAKPRPADAVVILGGGDEFRTAYGLAIYNNKLAPVVLLPLMSGQSAGTAQDSRVAVLMAGGVPGGAIEYIQESNNTWQEAENTLRLANIRGWHSVLMVSDPPHMRRLKWICGKLSRESNIAMVPVAGAPPWWDANRWWGNKLSAKYVRDEYIKICYYFLRNRLI